MEILKSESDKSVNFVESNMQESRFVQRVEDYFIVYLSSQNGCNKACRFCHLTQTGQTEFIDATLNEYVIQARYPIEHYKSLIANGQSHAKKVNFNFMARGEVFSNETVINNAEQLIAKLKNEVIGLNLETVFNFSTIGPYEIEHKEFTEIFKNNKKDVMIYYSLYSINASFRKRWMPKALPVNLMMEKLKRWQDAGGNIALHWAFIEGVNDSQKDLEEIIAVLDKYKLKAKFNLVRYNPFSENQGKEPPEEILNKNFTLLSNYLQNPHSRIVPRVGFDVKASCGMFVS